MTRILTDRLFPKRRDEIVAGADVVKRLDSSGAESETIQNALKKFESWADESQFLVGDLCISGGKVYLCAVEHTASTSTNPDGGADASSYWSEVDLSKVIQVAAWALAGAQEQIPANLLGNASGSLPASLSALLPEIKQFFGGSNPVFSRKSDDKLVVNTSDWITAFYSWRGSNDPAESADDTGFLASDGVAHEDDSLLLVTGFPTPTSSTTPEESRFIKFAIEITSLDTSVQETIFGTQNASGLPVPIIRINSGNLQYNSAGRRDAQTWENVNYELGDVSFSDGSDVKIIGEFQKLSHLDSSSEGYNDARFVIAIQETTDSGTTTTITSNDFTVMNSALLWQDLTFEFYADTHIDVWATLGHYDSHAHQAELFANFDDRLLGQLVLRESHSEYNHFDGKNNFENLSVGGLAFLRLQLLYKANYSPTSSHVPVYVNGDTPGETGEIQFPASNKYDNLILVFSVDVNSGDDRDVGYGITTLGILKGKIGRKITFTGEKTGFSTAVVDHGIRLDSEYRLKYSSSAATGSNADRALPLRIYGITLDPNASALDEDIMPLPE